MSRTVTNGSLAVVCDDPFEVWRAETAFTKEPGTIAWLDQLKPGDVFYDIGANIGIYTLIAAQKVGPTGMVYAFEPHIINAGSLLRNVRQAGLDNVQVMTCALHTGNDFFPFNYASMRAGSSGSQLGHTQSETGDAFDPKATEIKYGVTLDRLLGFGVLKPATLVKIDVDGNEVDIVRGMNTWLSGDEAPRSLQIEVRSSDRWLMEGLMRQHDYIEVSRHYTANGQQQIANGAKPNDVVSNTVFEKR